MKCFHCGSQLIWNNDFSYEDLDYDGDGIVSFYTCSNEICRAEYEVCLPQNDERR